MKPPVIDEADMLMVRAVGRRLQKNQFDEFTAQGRRCGWCRHPVRLRGVVMTNDGSGRRLAFSTGTLPTAYSSKRAAPDARLDARRAPPSTEVTPDTSCAPGSSAARAPTSPSLRAPPSC